MSRYKITKNGINLNHTFRSSEATWYGQVMFVKNQIITITENAPIGDGGLTHWGPFPDWARIAATPIPKAKAFAPWVAV